MGPFASTRTRVGFPLNLESNQPIAKEMKRGTRLGSGSDCSSRRKPQEGRPPGDFSTLGAVKILAATLVIAAAIAASATAAPQPATFTFRTAGGVRCEIEAPGTYAEALLRCDVRRVLKPRLRRPKGCRYHYGSSLELRAKGRVFPGCVRDAIAAPGPMIRAGKTYKRGPFTCKAARAGVSCRNAARHGFFVGKSAWRKI